MDSNIAETGGLSVDWEVAVSWIMSDEISRYSFHANEYRNVAGLVVLFSLVSKQAVRIYELNRCDECSLRDGDEEFM
jgi:hypothetical protein